MKNTHITYSGAALTKDAAYQKFSNMFKTRRTATKYLDCVFKTKKQESSTPLHDMYIIKVLDLVA